MDNDLQFEKDFWGDCTNTFDEEQKHYVYARGMGLTREHYSFNVNNKKILDIGGGPVSMLLKTKNLLLGKVCDPIKFPDWVYVRYKIKNILTETIKGEDLKEDPDSWDEVWIYNVLQHTDDPKKVLQNAKIAAPVIRIFEWIDIPPHEGHPHMLTRDNLSKWLGKKGGEAEQFSESGCYGTAFFGVFEIRRKIYKHSNFF